MWEVISVKIFHLFLDTFFYYMHKLKIRSVYPSFSQNAAGNMEFKCE